MISNQILQNTIEGLVGITKLEMSVTDTEGRVVVGTIKDRKALEAVTAEFVSGSERTAEKKGFSLYKIDDEQHLEYVLAVEGTGSGASMAGSMAAFQLESLLVAYREKFDKDNFIKNLLLDNLLLVDIYSRAKKLHMQTDAKRVVIVSECASGKDSNMTELVKEYMGKPGSRDIVTAVDENSVVIVKELDESEEDEIEKTADGLGAFLEKGGLESVRISYGTVVAEIKDVSRSYKEAKMAMDVGKIFFADRKIVAYNELGIGRLIYQLPLPLCKMFIQEIFDGKNPDDFDEETLTTIQKFFENSLNVSETSRQLFIHRNTLVYRLDKLQKSTNLDLRVFEDAITFKIALMVGEYMKYMEKQL